MEKEKNLERTRRFYLADPYKKNLAQIILGYLLIPIWFLATLATTLVLAILFVISPLKRKFLQESKEPYFKVRPIFPEESSNSNSNYNCRRKE